MTYTAKIFIQQLYESMYNFECDQLIVLLFNGTTEIKAGIPARQYTQK